MYINFWKENDKWEYELIVNLKDVNSSIDRILEKTKENLFHYDGHYRDRPWWSIKYFINTQKWSFDQEQDVPDELKILVLLVGG